MVISRRANGEGTIYQRKDKRWCAKLKIGFDEYDLKPLYKYFYAPTRREVKEKLEAYKFDESNGVTISTDSIEYHLTNWLARKRAELKPSSYDRVEVTVRKNIVPYLGSIKINELTTEDIQNRIVTRMINEGYSRSTIKKTKEALNNCINYLIGVRRVLSFNPCDYVVIPSQHVMRSAEIQFLSDSDIKLFKEAALSKYSTDTYIYPLGLIYVLILNTGIRRGEALAIKWSDFNEEDATLNINKSIANVIDWDAPKTEDGKYTRIQIEQSTKSVSSERVVPLNKSAIWCLSEIKRQRYFGKDSYIASTKTGEPFSERNLTKTFHSILKRAGLNKMGIHSLRHTFATQALIKGIDIKVISEILGHSSVDITYNTYIHVIKSQKAKAVEMIEI